MYDDNKNTLDDYITLYAEKYLNINADNFINNLQILANLNNVYAIQDWYEQKEIGTDENIDHLVTKYNDNDINQIVALANYYAKNEDINKQYSLLLGSLKQNENALKNFQRNTKEYIHYSNELKNNKIAIEKLPNISLWYKAYNFYNKVSRAQKSPIQLLLELKVMRKLIMNIPFKFHKKILIEELKSKNETIFNDLFFKFKSILKNNVQENIKRNRELSFVIGYLIITNEKYSEHKEIAHTIFRNLVSHGYSSIMTKS